MKTYEFNNRVSLQRKVIKEVNNYNFPYPLTGLSEISIKNFSSLNRLNNSIGDTLLKISEKLFFLANKSQEQITSEYKTLNSDVNLLTDKLKIQLKRM